MRISSEKRIEVTDVDPKSRDTVAGKAPPGHVALVRAVESATTATDRTGALLFVGGSHACDLPVQWAQAVLRLDRKASYWSHVALLLNWPKKADPSNVIGIEVSLDPVERAAQRPQRNGATLFRLARYLDAALYPRLAIGIVRIKKATPAPAAAPESKPPPVKDPRTAIVGAATDPIASVQRFPLWDWLGHWERYVRAGGSNPLVEHVPHPGAAFCEYAYEAAGLDLTPGATAPTTCPELLWSTLRHWSGSMGPGAAEGRVQIWSSDASGEPKAEKHPPSLRDDYKRWVGGSPEGGARRRRGK